MSNKHCGAEEKGSNRRRTSYKELKLGSNKNGFIQKLNESVFYL